MVKKILLTFAFVLSVFLDPYRKVIKFSDPREICLIWIRAVVIHAEFYYR